MRVDKSTGKGMTGMDKFSSKVHRVHMELGCKLLTPLRIKTQFFERLQSVSVVDGAAHTQKDDVESNGGSLENVADIFVLFLCGVQLVLRSGVLTVLDLNEVSLIWCQVVKFSQAPMICSRKLSSNCFRVYRKSHQSKSATASC